MVYLRAPWIAFSLVALFACSRAAGGEVDPTTLYDLTTDGTSQKVKVGSSGTFVLAIKTKNGSHVSGETPLKIDLSGEGVKLAKNKLTYADSVTRMMATVKFPDPRFEVSFVGEKPGKTNLDANVLFFICTEQACVRQIKKLRLPIQVE
jgi:hypothetical protein